jgi:pimeloyl-ACP methyl ester carboxylesterase
MNRFRLLKGVVALWLLVPGALLSANAGAVTPSPQGLWHGVLQTPAGAYLMELTIAQDKQGKPVASLESLDQAPGVAIPVSRVQLDDDRMRLEIGDISSVYEGRFDAEKHAWPGIWKQGISLPLTWMRGPVPSLPAIAGIDGTWRATLPRDGRDLRLILHIATSHRGTRAKLDSPDMGVAGLEVSELSREGDRVHWRVPAGQVVFEGELDGKAGRLSGSWGRAGMPAAHVRFARDAALPEQRPQTPQPPFPYTAVPVTFTDAKDKTRLAGTLTLPQGPGPFPAALLVSGSGPQDRDATVVGHKPFAVLADYLTRKGIAVLRYDDRGVGESGGDFGRASIPDFVDDARAAIDFLAARPEIDAKAIGLIGHSQGGIVGPAAALRKPSVAYMVLLAAPATRMSEVVLAQRRMQQALLGRSEASLTAEDAAWAKLCAVAEQAANRQQAQADIDAFLTPDMMSKLGLADTQRPATIDQFASDWMHDFLRYDAASTLRELRLPILALNGSLDRLVPAQANLAAIRNATAGHPDVTVLQLAGLNHMFQPARSGTMVEYGEIETTFAPEALRTIGEWISTRVGRQRQ